MDPRRILIKGGLRAGQRVFLSRPLGTGVIATAAEHDTALPLLPGARALAALGTFSGGMSRNRRHLEESFGRLHVDPAVPDPLLKMLCESETSGGLLFAVDPERAATVREAFARAGEPVWEIGEVTAEPRLALV